MKSAIYHGLCRGGPRDGRTHAQQDSRELKAEGGRYVFVPAKGTTPATWLWLKEKSK